jgi:hypothetical protein
LTDGGWVVGARFWVGPDPRVGVVDHLGQLFCLDCKAEGSPVYAECSYRCADDVCEVCREHICASYLKSGRPTNLLA